jgi:hypothetical protein
MSPPRSPLDPDGYYARLGVEPAATHEAIVAAFRRQARRLHPDVPRTGDTRAFLAVKQAYDVLSNRARRDIYDAAAREAAATLMFRSWDVSASRTEPDEPDWIDLEPAPARPVMEAEQSVPPPRLTDYTVVAWVGLAALLCLCVFEAVLHLRAPQHGTIDGIRANAAQIEPLSPSEQQAVLYGPAPVRLAGTPNYYVMPAAGTTVLWRKQNDNDYIPIRQLPPFSSVQALRLFRQSGLVEVRFDDTTNGFIDGRRLMPGDAAAARQAYCGYNAGPNPYNGELLQRTGTGSGILEINNRAVQPAVVKLRDASGAVALSVYLSPGGQADVASVPGGPFRAEVAVGELWSRGCNSFAAGMRARRLVASVTTMPEARLVVPPDEGPDATDIPEQAFEQD